MPDFQVFFLSQIAGKLQLSAFRPMKSMLYLHTSITTQQPLITGYFFSVVFLLLSIPGISEEITASAYKVSRQATFWCKKEIILYLAFYKGINYCKAF